MGGGVVLNGISTRLHYNSVNWSVAVGNSTYTCPGITQFKCPGITQFKCPGITQFKCSGITQFKCSGITPRHP